MGDFEEVKKILIGISQTIFMSMLFSGVAIIMCGLCYTEYDWLNYTVIAISSVLSGIICYLMAKSIFLKQYYLEASPLKKKLFILLGIVGMFAPAMTAYDAVKKNVSEIIVVTTPKKEYEVGPIYDRYTIKKLKNFTISSESKKVTFKASEKNYVVNLTNDTLAIYKASVRTKEEYRNPTLLEVILPGEYKETDPIDDTRFQWGPGLHTFSKRDFTVLSPLIHKE